MHNGFLQIGEEKMSKSLGNMLTIKEVLAKRSADAIRVFVLSSHYRSPLSFTWEGLEGAEKGGERLARAANRADNPNLSGITLDAESYRRQFIEAMDDDFNSAKGIGILFDLGREINQAADSGQNTAEARNLLKQLAGEVLGLQLSMSIQVSDLSIGVDEIERLIQERIDLRQAKQYQMADDIRKKLADLGILLDDTPKGTVWKQKK